MIKKVLTMGLVTVLSILNMTVVFAKGVEVIKQEDGKIINNTVLYNSEEYYEMREYVRLDISSFLFVGSDSLELTESAIKPERALYSYDVLFKTGDNYTTIVNPLVGQVAIYNVEDFKKSPYYVDNSNDFTIQGKTAYVAIPSTETYFLDNPTYAKAFNEARDNLFDIINPYELYVNNGVFTGMNSKYEFIYPETLDFKAYNDLFNDKTGAIEKINFAINTDVTNDRSYVLFELYAYNVSDYRNTTDMHIIGETEELVYAVKINKDSAYITHRSNKQFQDALAIITENDYEVLKESLVLPVSAAAALEELKERNRIEAEQAEQVVIPSQTLYINGEATDIEYSLINDQIYFPVRKTFDKIGYSIEWNQEDRSVLYSKENSSGIFKVDSNVYSYDDLEVRLEKSVQLVDGTTYFPVEFFAGVMPYHYVVRDNGAVYLILE